MARPSMLGHSLCVKFQFCEARFGDDFAARAREGDEINNVWNRGMRLDSNKPHSLSALRASDLLRSVLGDENGDLHTKPFHCIHRRLARTEGQWSSRYPWERCADWVSALCCLFGLSYFLCGRNAPTTSTNYYQRLWEVWLDEAGLTEK
jgi:hypothetical protein